MQLECWKITKLNNKKNIIILEWASSKWRGREDDEKIKILKHGEENK